jgi:hypothetical protein
VPGSPFDHVQIFDSAIKERKRDLAWRSAASMKVISLDRALALVLLLGAEADDRYEGSARALPDPLPRRDRADIAAR